jgi:hypothetical protein
MLTADSPQIGWGKYGGFEGAYTWGTTPFRLPPNPTENQKLLAVITSTESGTCDAINAYDRCIISVGLIQWCESIYLASNLLGGIAAKDPALLAPLQPALDASGASFKATGRGNYRFFVGDAEVDSADKQKKLFLLNSNGLIGSWDDASRAHVKLWVAALSNTLAQPAAMSVQVDYTASRVKGFAMTDAAALLFEGSPPEGWVGALRAAFLSFAANLPAVANKQVTAAARASTAPKWSADWCIELIKAMTFGPNISIYPGRYDKIRPVIEKLYGVDLPDLASDLQAWRDNYDQVDKADAGEPAFENAVDIQELLVALGYDIGPKLADGNFGPKSRQALSAFQADNGLGIDGNPGPLTRAKLLDAWRKLHA